MRRFLTLICMLGLAVPAGISISGCARNPAGNYCNGLGYGLTDTQVASLILGPQISGISLAYGQTTQVGGPAAYTCKGDPATVNAAQISYGTSNNQLADISPSGALCAGTWNRNSGGGIANYTYCYPPNPLPTTNGLPYGVAYITATTSATTSNPVAVYIHAPVTSTSLVTTCLASASGCSSTAPVPAVPSQCYSQNQTAQLDSQACYVATDSSGVSHQYEFCAPPSVAPANYVCSGGLTPGVTSVPSCGSSIGTLNFSVGNSSVGTINPTTNVITAELPGTTVITSILAQSSSSAGYFSTCPPASVEVSLANGGTNGVVTQGVTQNLTTTVTDTQGNPISGLSLTYQSTNPIDVTAGSNGYIIASHPGVSSVYSVCEPPTCNPAPINELGLNGTGLSLSSNPVKITVPGTTSDYVFFGAPGQSQYFYAMELLGGNPGSTVRLPYVPNSMVMDRQGSNLYFGSAHELMIYSTANDSITAQNTSVPGVVLAASPNASQLLINDQIRGLFYIFNVGGGSITTSTFGGMGVAAAWTPDANTLYIVDSAAANSWPQNIAAGTTNHTDTLYVYNFYTGWSTYSLSAVGGSESVAITVPGVGAYLAANPTVAHTWCPTGTVGNNATIQFYPQSDSIGSQNQVLGATEDGKHMLGAVLNGSSINFNDIEVTVPASSVCPETTTGTPPNLVETMMPLSTNPTLNGSVSLTGVTNAASSTNTSIQCGAQCLQVVTGTEPSTLSLTTAAPVAFVTYYPKTGSSTAAQLPFYLPQTSGATAPGYVTFADATSSTPPTAPLAGAFSPDNSIFFVSTAGDNEIHFISIPPTVTTSGPTAPSDTQQVSPALPACTPVSAGGDDAGCLYPTAPAPNAVVPATVVTVKPRSVT